MALTKRRIDELKFEPAGPAQQILFDEALPGFGVRVYPSGRKSFVLWYRTSSGRKRLAVVGGYGEMTLQQARERAQRTLVGIRDGEDPVAGRREARVGLRLSAFAELYLERHARPHKKSWREDERRLQRYILPRWGRRRADEMTRGDVVTLHTEIGKTAPVEANRVRALISVMYSCGTEWGLLPEGYINPASRVRAFRERSRERWIQPDELPRLVASILEEENPFHRAAFLLYLLTGLRRSELLSLRWEHVDLGRSEVTLPETKAGRSHTVPLSTPAATLLRELPRMATNAHVFPAAFGEGHMSDLKKPWRRIRGRAGLGDVRLHDLRRTVGSLLAQDGASLQLIGKVLNHSDMKTTAIYARLTENAARDALEQHGSKIVFITEQLQRAAREAS
jgi:integrase